MPSASLIQLHKLRDERVGISDLLFKAFNRRETASRSRLTLNPYLNPYRNLGYGSGLILKRS